MPRVRSAKSIASRVDLQYFTRLTGFRRWRFILSAAIPIIAVGWLVTARAVGNHKVYSSGPMSSAHAVFGQNCGLCHLRNSSFSARVEDRTCLACHDAPTHTAVQTFTPSCSSCHLEHRGKYKLADTADIACSRCHAKLQTKDGQLHFDPHISKFDDHHVEFAPVRGGGYDYGTIKLNHYVHLQPTLRGPNGPVQMVCGDCHRPTSINSPWPYSVAVVQPASQQPVLVGMSEAQQRKRRSAETGAGPYMASIKYVNQCAACHTLQFDPLIDQPAPHDKPEIVRAFIISKLTDLVRTNPQVIHQPVLTGDQAPEELPRNTLRPTRDFAASPTPPPATASEWVVQRTQAAERLLWKGKCQTCHSETVEEGDKLPTSVKAVIPTRWFTHAEFDHEAHRMMTCISCHSHIPASKQTSDINLPGIATCRNCHKADGPSKGAAEGRCFECHSYHDWRKEQPVKSKFSIATLRGND